MIILGFWILEEKDHRGKCHFCHIMTYDLVWFMPKHFFKYFKILFMAALGLCCFALAFRCSERLQCINFLLPWLLLLWSMGSRCTGFSSCSAWAYLLQWMPDQELNPCLLHWQVDLSYYATEVDLVWFMNVDIDLGHLADVVLVKFSIKLLISLHFDRNGRKSTHTVHTEGMESSPCYFLSCCIYLFNYVFWMTRFLG